MSRLIDRERRALKRLEVQKAMYSQIEFGISTLDLKLLTGLISHAEEHGVDSTPARLAVQDVRKRLREKEKTEAAAAIASQPVHSRIQAGGI